MDVYLYGAGGHAKVIMDILAVSGKKVVAFVEDNLSPDKLNIHGIPVISANKLSSIGVDESAWIVAIGNNKVRQKVADHLRSQGYRFATAIHPSVQIGSDVKIGPGTVIMANAVINVDTVIGSHVIINTGATVDHDCQVNDYAHIAPGCSLCGQVSLGEGSLLGVGTKVIPATTIGQWTVCGAGSIVNKSLPSSVVAYGCPAKIYRSC